MNAHAKAENALHYWLQGANFFKALEAKYYAKGYHKGTRKDGVTPEFAHQIWIANVIRTLPLERAMMERCMICAFLHDVCEDYEVTFEEIRRRFGEEAADDVERMTKKYRGVVVDTETYFRRLAESPVAALVKGVDRTHNVHSMSGVFQPHKQRAYILESRERHLPMLKLARRQFPQWEPAYENIKQTLNARLGLIEQLLDATAPAPVA